MSLLEHACYAEDCQCPNLHINRPKYPNTNCTGGIECINANCDFAHPVERIPPPRIDKLCRDGARCKNRRCMFVHPVKTAEKFINRKGIRCKFGTNCEKKDCGKSGHDLDPVRCKYGNKCRNKNSACPFLHSQIDAVCPYGESCRRAESCWYKCH